MTDRKSGAIVPRRGNEPLVRARDQRSASRTATLHNAAVKLGSISYVVEVADISTQGAQIVVRHGLMPAFGQCVSLQFLNGLTVEADVVWAKGSNAGVQFREPVADVADIVHFDDLGAEYFGAVLKFQLAVREP
jgi:hypothetical protein